MAELWDDQEGRMLGSTIRRDMRHLLAHGACHFKLTRNLYQAFKDAHPALRAEVTLRPKKKLPPQHFILDGGHGVGNRAPENVSDLVIWLNTAEAQQVFPHLIAGLAVCRWLDEHGGDNASIV